MIYTSNNCTKPETGHSMVEMLGVLALIGVLSIGGIAGYRYAVLQIATNRALDIQSHFYLMYETEKANWDKSSFNLEDNEYCKWDDKACHAAENEYFCTTYGDPSYCKNMLSGGADGWYGYYTVTGNKDFNSAFMWGITAFVQKDSNDPYNNQGKRVLNLRFRTTPEACEKILMAVYKSPACAVSGYLGYAGGDWYCRSRKNNDDIVKVVHNTCYAPSNMALTGKLTNFSIPLYLDQFWSPPTHLPNLVIARRNRAIL